MQRRQRPGGGSAAREVAAAPSPPLDLAGEGRWRNGMWRRWLGGGRGCYSGGRGGGGGGPTARAGFETGTFNLL
uniref:Uncharacterized protein n=1 Tax=Oryza sativa subsp. japonica TaxID=39947 RepID=Q8H410_ORYSJ|nr:hypothetical protein [Oryza sativa Japonica Group]